ncbi:30S ribosomal protein S8 [Candidatus Woesearchaeota archaeon]|nr:30S ribosomal protein S8 [Candidatus Woesearchaeota archaeon]
MLNDPLSNAMSKIRNAEAIGQRECVIKPTSKTIKALLTLLNAEGYIGQFEEVADGRGGHLKVNLLGYINKCGSIKPRHAVGFQSYQKFEKRYLPARDFGVLVVSTSSGLFTHQQAKQKKIGGKLIAYCY